MSFGGRIKRGPMAADVFEQQFTQIYNGLFRDPRLSFKAKGIFGLISTHRDGFGVSLESIAACATDGISGVRTGLLELIEFQYLRRDRTRDELGRLGDSVYFITDMPDGLIILMNPDWDVAEVETCRSEPKCDSPMLAEPTLDEPTLGDRSHKKTNHPEHQLEEHQKDVAPPGAKRPRTPKASTGSSVREAAGGFAAADKSKLARLTKQQNATVDAVYDLLPAEVRAVVPRNARGLPQAILAALGAGEPWERTVDQLLQYRVMPRWDRHWASLFFAGEVKQPVGMVRKLLKRDPLCNDHRCDEHLEVDSGLPCRSCTGKRLNGRGGKSSAEAGPQQPATPPAWVPEQTGPSEGLPKCSRCTTPMMTRKRALCWDCEEDALAAGR